MGHAARGCCEVKNRLRSGAQPVGCGGEPVAGAGTTGKLLRQSWSAHFALAPCLICHATCTTGRGGQHDRGRARWTRWCERGRAQRDVHNGTARNTHDGMHCHGDAHNEDVHDGMRGGPPLPPMSRRQERALEVWAGAPSQSELGSFEMSTATLRRAERDSLIARNVIALTLST